MPDPHDVLHLSLKRILEDRATLSRENARLLLERLLQPTPDDSGRSQAEADGIRVAALLGAMAARGETPEEIAGFVDAMRAVAMPLPLTDAERATLVDSCGTGGDNSNTFNISTAAALVAAAAGATAGADMMVAKHGNRAVTSRSGSADVLEALGIPVNLSPDQAADALRRHRFAFLLAPSHHPAMKAFLPIRRALGIRTIFNILGPLTNPAGAQAQVMGVYAAHLVPLVAEAMALLGTRHAYVVHGTNIGPFGRDGAALAMDELSITGLSEVAEVRAGQVNAGMLSYSDFGIRHAPVETLRGGTAAENAQILRHVFAGEQGPRRDIVLLNAAAVLTAAGVAEHLGHGFQIAGETVDSGAVTELVARLSA